MRIDVSEVKNFKSCKRKWSLSSRNKFHTTPLVKKDVFRFGTATHELLHELYLGGDVQRCLDRALTKCNDEPERRVMTSIALGYSSGPLLEDLERFHIMDIERKFSFTLPGLPDVQVTGSIDMVAIDKKTNEIFGFEHKTCKAFRPDIYTFVDEQPRLYYYALSDFVNQLNEAAGAEEYSLGGVYINEIKKVQRDFQYKRTLCKYSPRDLAEFIFKFINSCHSIIEEVGKDGIAPPEPSLMNCTMCEFSNVCLHYGYVGPSTVEEFLEEFGLEFEVRTVDHLDEEAKKHIPTPSDIV